jgi:hypothetical protein
VSGGVQQVQVVLGAPALLQLANGAAAPRIAGVILLVKDLAMPFSKTEDGKPQHPEDGGTNRRRFRSS